MHNAKYLIMPTALFLIVTSIVLSQTPPSAFLRARQERDEALRTDNAKVYDEYTTNNFVIVMPDGSLETKAERLAIMTNAKQPEELGKFKDERMTIVRDTIITNWIASIQGKDARFTEVWVKVDGTWKVAGAHVSMIQR